ncbi:MAG: alpha-glucosidase/alpha-galactosidase, partial [Armatimonadota bacterium]
MTKITMIGAGSAGFCRMLIQDILCFDSMKDAHFALFDVNEKRLKTTFNVMQKMKEQNKLKCTFTATLDRKEALKDADFAISMIQVGGLEPYQLDIDIPLKYGVDQCVGDTVNPGGIFRGLRHVPALLDILKDMEEVCPDVIFMNYANPMAICSWAMQKEYPHIQSVGLCHGIQHTTSMLCDWLGVPKNECEISVAGINHMAWFLEFLHNGKDLYPMMWEKIENEGGIKGEEYRFEMFKAVGYFMTESPGHLSEYLPYFRKRKDLMDLFSGDGFSGATAAYLNFCKAGLDNYNKEMADYESGAKPVPYDEGNKSVEYAADIMNAKITGNIFKHYGNILNKGYISNLPYNCCVEVQIG